LSSALEMARIYIQNTLHGKSMDHLYVRRQAGSLLVYSDETGTMAKRAMFTRLPGNDYALCIANPRGRWELIPAVGELPVLLDILTDQLAFALARWPHSRTNHSAKRS